jgi:hypothetical protein
MSRTCSTLRRMKKCKCGFGLRPLRERNKPFATPKPGCEETVGLGAPSIATT